MPKVTAAEGMERDITGISFYCTEVFSTSHAIEKKPITVSQGELTVQTLEYDFTIKTRC